MPMYGSEQEMQELMARHTRDGLGEFREVRDPALSLLRAIGNKVWGAPCGCTVSVPETEEAKAQFGRDRGTFHPTKEHLEWLNPTPRERAVLGFLEAPIFPSSEPRKRGLFGRRKRP
jgi:hypothetical protein